MSTAGPGAQHAVNQAVHVLEVNVLHASSAVKWRVPSDWMPEPDHDETDTEKQVFKLIMLFMPESQMPVPELKTDRLRNPRR